MLVVAEITCAVVLPAGAGHFRRNSITQTRVDAGLNPKRLGIADWRLRISD
jgi:hypothetical protein